MGMWTELASASGAALIEVPCKTDLGSRFCNGFRVGACLRYPVAADLLETENASPMLQVQPSLEKHLASDGNRTVPVVEDPDCESVSTAPSDTDSLLHEWLVEALTLSLQDKMAAESLAISTEVVLFDDTVPLEERLEATLEMLRGEN